MMVNVGLWVRIEAKPGKETEVRNFLVGALAAANAETLTPVWFAVQLAQSTFAIFDAFADEAARRAHLSGAIAAALMEKAQELLAQPPKIEELTVLAVKLPH